RTRAAAVAGAPCGTRGDAVDDGTVAVGMGSGAFTRGHRGTGSPCLDHRAADPVGTLRFLRARLAGERVSPSGVAAGDELPRHGGGSIFRSHVDPSASGYP